MRTALRCLAVQVLAPAALALAGQQSPCAEAVAAQRSAWHVVDTPRSQPPGASGELVRHWPTDTLGIWVVETEHGAGGRVSLRRVTPTDTTEIAWSRSCQATTTTSPRQPPAPLAFTDSDLRRMLDAHPRGLIYVWSPHMPLSAEGIATIRTVGRQRQLPVVVLLDPAADLAFARATLAASGLADDDVRVVDSTELTFRDVLVHAPTMQAYDRGRLVGSPYPGFHAVDEYAAFLDRVLLPSP